MFFTLKRIAQDEYGTYGVLLKDGKTPVLVTLEDRWNNNEPYISCIPTGAYQCKRINSPTHGNVFEVTNVPNRTHILIHIGNIEDNTEGCILVGSEFETLKGKTAVTESTKAFEEFMGYVQGLDHFLLVIVTKI